MLPLEAPLFAKNTEIEVYIKRAQGFKIVYNHAWLTGRMGGGKKNDEMIIADDGLIHSDRTSLEPPTAM